jgi:hypothetical protein
VVYPLTRTNRAGNLKSKVQMTSKSFGRLTLDLTAVLRNWNCSLWQPTASAEDIRRRSHESDGLTGRQGEDYEADSAGQWRAEVGNDLAIKAYRDGTLPFPDGAIIAALH